uniref:Protein alan shepard n=1 Tax=Ditylenchus dipsaci TaxID=166011 RepID=A0A915DYF4_9BILA
MVNRAGAALSNNSTTVNGGGCVSFSPMQQQQQAPMSCDPQAMAVSNYSGMAGSRFYSSNPQQQHPSPNFYATAVVPTTSNGYSSAAASFGRNQIQQQQDAASPRALYQPVNTSSNAQLPMHQQHYQKANNNVGAAGVGSYRRYTHHQQHSNPAVDLNGGGRRSTMSSLGYNDEDKFTPLLGGGGGAANYKNETMLSDTNLYIRGLSADTTDDQLREMCEPYGKIVSTKAIIDKATNQCKGYGFVDFDTAEAARSAVKLLAEKNIQAQMAKQQEQDPTNLYIANLPNTFTEEMLEELLNAEGMVISTRILRNPDGSSRCVGFARMHSKECCDAIISKFHGRCLDEEGTQPLVVKLADSSRKSKRSISSSGVYSDNSVGNRLDLASAGLAAGMTDQFVYAHDYAQQQHSSQAGAALFSMPDAAGANRQLSYVSFGGAGGQPQYHFLAGAGVTQQPYGQSVMANPAYSPAPYDTQMAAALASQMHLGLNLENSDINTSNANSAGAPASMHAYSIGPYQYFANPNPYMAAYPVNMQTMESHMISNSVQPNPAAGSAAYIAAALGEMVTMNPTGTTETAYCYDSTGQPSRPAYKPAVNPNFAPSCTPRLPWLELTQERHLFWSLTQPITQLWRLELGEKLSNTVAADQPVSSPPDEEAVEDEAEQEQPTQQKEQEVESSSQEPLAQQTPSKNKKFFFFLLTSHGEKVGKDIATQPPAALKVLCRSGDGTVRLVVPLQCSHPI